MGTGEKEEAIGEREEVEEEDVGIVDVVVVVVMEEGEEEDVDEECKGTEEKVVGWEEETLSEKRGEAIRGEEDVGEEDVGESLEEEEEEELRGDIPVGRVGGMRGEVEYGCIFELSSLSIPLLLLSFSLPSFTPSSTLPSISTSTSSSVPVGCDAIGE